MQFLDALMDVSTTGIRGLNGFDVKTILRIRRIIPNSPGVIIQTKKLAKSERRFEETSKNKEKKMIYPLGYCGF